MTDTTLVKPWPGLILADVPPNGAQIPTALAEEWIANHLVIAVPKPPEQEPGVRQAEAIRPINRRRSK